MTEPPLLDPQPIWPQPILLACWQIFRVFLWLGLTAFGGPLAHIGIFRTVFVAQRGWLSDHAFADRLALCQFLPGPTSSQLGMTIGMERAGLAGAVAAWLGFTLPSMVLMILWAEVETQVTLPPGMVQGLGVAAVAVVAQAVWGMGRTFCRDKRSLAVALAASAVTLGLSGWQTPLLVMAGAAMIGAAMIGAVGFTAAQTSSTIMAPPRPYLAGLALGAVVGMPLTALPALATAYPHGPWPLVDSLFRVGATVFGGGHVVLPLLQSDIFSHHWLSPETLLAGYGVAQALPGPLLSIAAFIGTAMGGPTWGLVATVAIFAPSLLLLMAILPFWKRLSTVPPLRAGLNAVNASTVGILLAALINPMASHSLIHPATQALAGLAVVALMSWKLPPWAVVIACGIAGWVWVMV